MHSFRIRFKLAPIDAINIAAIEFNLPLANGTEVLLTTGARTEPIAKARELIAKRDGFATEDEARVEGEKVLHTLKLALAALRMGADFGNRSGGSFYYNVFLRRMEKDHGMRIVNDVHGLMTYTTNPPLGFAQPPSVSILRHMQQDRFQTAIALADKQSFVPTPRELLAFELYNASFFELTSAPRFICLVMAVEALLEPPLRSEKARAFVDRVLADLDDSGLDHEEKQSLLGSIKWLYCKSISATGRNLARERLPGRKYNGMRSDKFFNHCYDLRSKLVHGHGIRGDNSEVGQAAAYMEQFVADLLAGYRIGFDL